MDGLTTTYMGLSLANPLVVAASSISAHVDLIKLAEDVGAGALVIRSLFEEQIQLDQQHFDDLLMRGSDSFAEATTLFPKVRYGGPKEHLMWVERSRKAVKMPLIASLNAVSPGAWTHYARQLAETGVDGLEINYYVVAADPQRTGSDVERALFEVVESVVSEVTIPVAVKLSPFYTSTANVVHELEKRGAKAVVLFNRFLQPDIAPDLESLSHEMVFSTQSELKLPLRWIALLYGRTTMDLALSTGAHTGKDVIKALLAGATVVQTAAALLQNGVPYLSTMLFHLQTWMAEKGYDSLDDFRGNLSQKHCDDPFAFERAQYVKLILEQV
jgi:dihydroorotate dehydrogenase (fumarate)